MGDTDSPSGICFSIIFLLLLFFFFLHNNNNSYALLSAYCVPGPTLSTFYTGSGMVGEKEPRAGIQALLLAGFIYSLITSVTKCLLSTYCMPKPVLGDWDTQMCKTSTVPAL